MRQHLPLYGLVMVLGILAFLLGVRTGRDHPRPMWEQYGIHLFQHQNSFMDWLNRHI
jgi:hypothetical protein